MKSRYFSIPGLLVDVTEVVGIRCCKDGWWVMYRNGMEFPTGPADAKSIQEYIEEYERHQFDVSRSLAASLMPSFMTSGTVEA